MVNQLVFVTELFFKEERKAIEEGENMWREFEQRFAEQAPIGPLDPVESLHKAIREMAPRSSSTLTLAAAMDEQMEYGAWEARCNIAAS